VYLISLFCPVSSVFEYVRSTLKDFNCGNLSATLAESWVRWLSC